MTEQVTDKVLTPEGLTLKGLSKINRLNCDAKWQDATLVTWQCSRLVRRDFYLVCYKMFMAARKHDTKGKIRQALQELREEAEVIENMALRYERNEVAPHAVLNMRVVDDNAQILLDSILTVDRALAKLNTSDMADVAADNCGGYFAAYARLKKLVVPKHDVQLTTDKTSMEAE